MKNKNQNKAEVVSHFNLLATRRAFYRADSERGLPRAVVLSSRCFQRLYSLMAGVTALVGTHALAAGPDYNAPWQDSSKKAPAPKKQNSTSPANPTAASPTHSTSAADSMLDKRIALRKPAKNEVSASADYFFGSGTVSVPFGYSLATVRGNNPNLSFPTVAIPAKRDSVYFGATISYSHGQAWYLDFSYLNGANTVPPKEFSIPNTKNNLNAAFGITEDWYQAFLRYTFPKLRGTKLSAYLRAGFSYVQADLTSTETPPANSINYQPLGYSQKDRTTDLLGSIGLGASYLVYNHRLRVSLQVEGEGFYGTRSQDIQEEMTGILIGAHPTAAHIENTFYGGSARGTVHAEYRFGSSGFFKIFADGGLQIKVTEINYPGIGSAAGSGTLNELLWGPYVKFGMRYSF